MFPSRERKTDHPSSTSPATIEQAYGELSQEAFAAWIRLMVVADPDRLVGRHKVAEILGLSTGRSNVVLRELRNKGYIRFEPGDGPGTPTTVVLERKALLVGRDHFVKLSNTLAAYGQAAGFSAHPGQPEPGDRPGTLSMVLRRKWSGSQSPSLVASDANSCQSENSENSTGQFSHFHSIEADPIETTKSEKVTEKTNGNKVIRQKCKKGYFHNFDDLQTEPGTPSPIPRKSVLKSAKNDQSEASAEGTTTRSESGIASGPDGDRGSKPAGLNTDRFLQEREKIKRIRSERSKKAIQKKRREEILKEPVPEKRESSLAGFLERADDLKGCIAVFNPTPAQREQMIDVLLGPRNKEWTRLRQRLGHRFKLIYSKYRRRLKPSYRMVDKEQRLAEEVAALCIVKEVNPTRLIAYWAENCGRFTNMKFPALNFLVRAGIVEEVACLADRADRPPYKAATTDRLPVDRPEAHAYADTSRLDPGLRPGLLGAGFSLEGISDRYLMTVQSAARALAEGFPMYIAPPLRPLVNWAVANLYRDLK